ncbi:MAG: hypothetical protein Q9219_004152 [cf. Caloplaca sp. 3 TL-2023]
MTFAPERITVKRRRDEEPVDALYFPPQKSRKTVIWNRVSEGHSGDDEQKTSPAIIECQAQIPLVRTTLPEEDIRPPPLPKPASSQSPPARDAAVKANGRSQRTGISVDKSPLLLPREARKFHLTRSSTSRGSSSVLHGGIQKIRKKQTKRLAVFVERTDHVHKSSHRYDAKSDECSLREDFSKSVEESSTPRKRPLASPVERAWRAHNWEQSLKRDPPNESETSTTSLELARQLQQFAMDVSQTTHEAPHEHRSSYGKVKPKPPGPRMAKTNANEIGGAPNVSRSAVYSSDGEEDPEDFVFDVYVRQTEHVSEPTTNGTLGAALVKADPDRIGVLVVEDEDQEIWELYGDESSDEEWNSEEEDENAEDYYGNDYPEDELDSDDEYDKATYKHWHSAFEEDMDDDIDWFDDELIGEKAWRHH